LWHYYYWLLFSGISSFLADVVIGWGFTFLRVVSLDLGGFIGGSLSLSSGGMPWGFSGFIGGFPGYLYLSLFLHRVACRGFKGPALILRRPSLAVRGPVLFSPSG